MVAHVRRIPLDALEVETSSAAGEQALQALLQCASEHAGKLEAHEAETGLFTRRMPIGLAAMKRSCAPRGTGEGGPAVPRADGGLRPRAQKLRARDDCSRCGPFAVARTCDRTPGEPGSFPLDTPINRPARCSSYCLPEGMSGFAVAHPVRRVRAGSRRSLRSWSPSAS